MRRRAVLMVLVGFFGMTAAWVWLFRIPFWLTAPDGFCHDRRLATPVCHGHSPGQSAQPPSPVPLLPVYIVGHSWHTGLMLRTEDIPDERWTADIDLEGVKAIEIGWGDEGFYRATEYTVGLAAEALLLPTPSVIHLVLLPNPATENFPRSDVSVFWADPQGYQRLLDFIDRTFAKGSDGRLISLGPGIYGNSMFYRAVGSFHFPKSCNYWVASALKQAGAPIWVGSSITAGNTLRQVGFFGEVIRDVPGFKILPN